MRILSIRYVSTVLCFSCFLLSAEYIRYLSTDQFSGGIEINATIEVRFDTISPEYFIIDEIWPEGTQLRWCKWNGHTIECNSYNSEFKWLIGEEDDQLLQGTLSYSVSIPSKLKTLSTQVSGYVEYYDGNDAIAGDKNLYFTEDDPYANALEISLSDGWNLLSFPCQLSENNLRLLKNSGLVFYKSGDTPHTPAYITSIDNLTAGTPFWVYLTSQETPFSFYQELDESSLSQPGEIVPSSGYWRNGWNMVGVRGSESIAIDSSTSAVWEWDSEKFNRCTDTLEPGHAYWIYRREKQM